MKAVDEILTRWREDAREWSPRQRTASDACVECWSWPLRTALPVDTPNALVHRLRQAFDDSVRLESARHMERLAVEYATDDVDALFEIDEALDRIVSFEQDLALVMSRALIQRRSALHRVVVHHVWPRIDQWVAEMTRYLLVADEEG